MKGHTMSIARTPAEVATAAMGIEPTTDAERAEWARIRDAIAADRAASGNVRVSDLDGSDDAADWVTVGHVLDAHDVTYVRSLRIPVTDAAGSDRAERDEIALTLPSGQTLRVWVGTSDFDGSALVQIDTEDAHGNVRVFVNDSGEPVFNENPETGEYEDASRECDRCGDEVATLSTDDLCDGCVAEDATATRCRECGERVEADDMGAGYGMCGSCLHDAIRSGWEPGADA